jgi:hypothetical protein
VSARAFIPGYSVVSSKAPPETTRLKLIESLLADKSTSEIVERSRYLGARARRHPQDGR